MSVTKECIFEGRFTQVYRTADGDGKPIVIKQLRRLYPDAEELARYSREFEITRNAKGPKVIGAYRMEVQEGTVALVLEDFGATSLAQILARREEPLPLEMALLLAVQVAEGLSHIHQQDIIHKDINPSNIVWNEETGVVKLIDFGISQVLSRTSRSSSTLQFMGTPAYISPEQTGRMNRSLDSRSDLYSFGVTLYELLTGQRPFTSDDPLELVHSHIARAPIPPKELVPELFPQLSDMVMTLLSKRAEDRYSSAAGLKYDLDVCLEAAKEGRPLPGDFQLRQHDQADRLRIPQKLYGRQKEVRQLVEAVEKAASGDVRVLLVSGYSGVGKTRVVHEVHRPLTASRGIFVEGKFDQLNRGTPYDSLVQAFRSFIRHVLTESEERIEHWRKNILEVVGANGRVLTEVIPEAEHLLGVQPTLEEVGPQESRNRFQLVMSRFLRVLGSAEHPLVLFLDDLQWADLPTVELIGRMATEPENSHILFIGAYRDNEVDSAHPLQALISELQSHQVGFDQLSLGPLEETDVLELVGDTVGQAPGFIRLALACQNKTRGNAFFLNRFLESLYVNKLLVFEAALGQWTWDLEGINVQAITDNVVDFLSDQIRDLPESNGRALQAAACIGNVFELETLAGLLGSTLEETIQDLQGALKGELVQPIDENFWYTAKASNFKCQFAHDRIQQAAYSMLDDEESVRLNLELGRLLKDSDEESVLFKTVEHLNRGVSLITEPSELHELGKLNLKVGRLATRSAAFAPAHKYYTRAHELLGNQAWEEHYEHALAVHVEGARAAYLSGHYHVMEARLNKVNEHAKDLLDKIEAEEVRIAALVGRQELAAAVKAALEVVAELGFGIPADPTKEQVEQSVAEVLQLLKDQDLASLPETDDPRVRAAVRIQNGVVAAAYLAAPNLFPILCTNMVKTSLKHGLAPQAVYAFSALGLVLISVNLLEEGYNLGKAALQMSERFEDRAYHVKNLHVVGGIINGYMEPLKRAVDVHRETYSLGIDAGDLEYAAWGLHNELANSLWSGTNLHELAQTMEHHTALMKHHVQMPALAVTYQLNELVDNLRLEREQPQHLKSDAFDEDKSMKAMLAAQFRGAIFSIAVAGMVSRYTFGDFEGALERADTYAEYQDGVQGTYLVVIWNQYRALAALRLGKPDLIEQNLEQLKTWAKAAPANFRHRVKLVEAELRRVEGDEAAAVVLYESAIRAAQKNGFIQDEALANELAARYVLTLGFVAPGRGYLMQALFLYRRWGADGKASHLETEFAEVLAGFRRHRGGSDAGSTSGTSTTSGSQVDLVAMVRASQAVSREIVLDKLIESLVSLAMEVGGAQRGLLLLREDKRWVVTCEGIVDAELALSSLASPLGSYKDCPQKLVAYCLRTREDVILSDAAEAGLFKNDDYIRRRRSRSVLCLPIKQQNEVTAVLYLENDLTAGAFTEQHLDLLRLLATQAAISLENAKLYNTLERRVQERTRELQAEVKQRTRAEEELRVLATTDSLTGAANRRHFLEVAEQELHRIRRYPAPLAALMLDADHFKLINDSYGHDVGDQVLRKLSQAVKASLRTSETFGRLGGEEFAIVLPQTNAEGAAVVAERLRSAIEDLRIPVSGDEIQFTVSVGVAEARKGDASFAAVLTRADEALYAAKAGGRNRVVVAESATKA